jgi:hypothetical protein
MKVQRGTAVRAVDTPLNGKGPTYPDLGIDDGLTPSLGLVRLYIKLSAPTGPLRARVRITATCNDLHQHAFARRATKFQKEHSVGDYYYLCYPSGHVYSFSDFRTEAHVTNLVLAGHLSLDVWFGQPIQFFKGVSCCFREDKELILVKDGQIIYASRPEDFTSRSSGSIPQEGPLKGPPKQNKDYELKEGANLDPMNLLYPSNRELPP